MPLGILLATAALLFAVTAGAAPAPTLRVATSGDYAPFSRDGAGFDIDVGRALAKDLGYRIKWVSFRWPELERAARSSSFDIAMGGITWKPDRAVSGYLSRSVASGGPCVLYARPYGPAAVNRGGILEQFALARFGAARVVAVNDNASLPGLLANGEAGALVTDSFELPHFKRSAWRAECEPPRDRKVYWIAPARAATLGPRVDAWIASNEARLAQLRARWFGEPAPRTPTMHLVDLIARRLALMPSVAAYKRAHRLPIADPKREERVLAAARSQAHARGAKPGVVRFFELQIELAKLVQLRAPSDARLLDLNTELRPTLLVLGERLVDALADCKHGPRVTANDLDVLVPLLDPEERHTLLTALNTACAMHREDEGATGVRQRTKAKAARLARVLSESPDLVASASM